jgi:hypothetical protein
MDFYQPGCRKDGQLKMYEPKSCSLPMFAQTVPVKPKRVLFVGDSVGDSQAQSFAWFFDESRPQDIKKCAYDIKRAKDMVVANLTSAGFTEEEVKATADFVGNQNVGKKWNLHEWWGCQSKTSFILADKPPPEEAVKGFMHTVRNFYSEPLGADDVVVMGFGIWMDDRGVFRQKGEARPGDRTKSLQMMLEEVKSWGADAPKLIYREITPSHWNSWDGYWTPEAYRTTTNQCKQIGAKSMELLAKKPSGLHAKTNSMFMQAIKDAGMAVDGTQVEFMPVWKAAVQRVDDHPITWDNPLRADCTHFCAHGSVNRFMNSATLAVASGMLQRAKTGAKTV